MTDALLRLSLILTDEPGDPRGDFSASVTPSIYLEPRNPNASPVANFPPQGLCLDFVELVASIAAAGSYYILNCGCGIPECARLQRPIEVEHDPAKIIWHIPGREDGYEVSTPKVVFDRVEYQSEFSRVVRPCTQFSLAVDCEQ